MTTPHPAVASFSAIRDSMRQLFVGREGEIDAINLALVCQHHLVMIGEPGVAKSDVAELWLDHIDGVIRFHEQVSRADDISKYWGPMSIPALKNERRLHVIKGFAPEADVWNMEELFDGSGMLLRSFLLAANERKFRNDGVMSTIPLKTIIGSTNFTPDENHENYNDLAAFFDRFLLRRYVTATYDKSTLDAIWELDRPDTITPLVTWADVLDAQQAVIKVPVTGPARDAVEEIVVTLRREGIAISPRRFRQTKRLLQGAAFLDGVDEADLPQVERLADCFWMKPDQITLVERTVMTASSPQYKALLEVSDSVTTLVDEAAKLDQIADDDPARSALAVAIYNKLKEEAKKLDGMNLHGRAESIGADTMRRLETLHRRAMEVGHGLKPQFIPSLRDDLDAE